MKRNNIFLFLIVLLSITIGYLFGSKNILNFSTLNSENKSINKLDRLITYLTSDYVDKINSDSLVSKVIEDIIDKLDPHSIYIPAEESESLSESMKGNFEGIGVQFRMLNDTIAVSRVLDGGGECEGRPWRAVFALQLQSSESEAPGRRKKEINEWSYIDLPVPVGIQQ